MKMNLKNQKKIQGRDLNLGIDYGKTKRVPSGIFERTANPWSMTCGFGYACS